MPFYRPYNLIMDITSYILTAECERLGPSYSVGPTASLRHLAVYTVFTVQII